MGGMTGSLLLLLLWAGVSVSTMVDLQKRIIHGHVCNNNERLYHVQLDTQIQADHFLCGGSLISDRWILTAAHCWNVTHGVAITAILRVHPHGHQINEPINVNMNIHRHNNADIMLLRLTTPRRGFEKIHLPNCTRHPSPRNVMVQIAGHAATTAFPNGTRNPHVVGDLHCANIRAVNCPRNYQHTYGQMFCGETTDVTNRVGICLGDSGGGVVYNNRLYGVIHGVHPTNVICTGPDYYVDVCQYITWITQITGIVPP